MQGRYKESALAYEHVLALLNKTVPLEHPDVATAFGGLAIAYKRTWQEYRRRAARQGRHYR